MNKTFTVKLLDNGIREYRDEHSSVKCQICSRDKFKNLSVQDENHSLYFLKGFHDGKLAFYVGRSKNIKSRLNDHLLKKDFWEEVIIFIKKEDNKGFILEIEHLEKHFIEIIDKSDYYIVNDGITYNTKCLDYSEQKIVESINDFLVILGYDFINKSEIKGILPINNSELVIDLEKYYINNDIDYHISIEKELNGKLNEAIQYALKNSLNIKKVDLNKMVFEVMSVGEELHLNDIIQRIIKGLNNNKFYYGDKNNKKNPNRYGSIRSWIGQKKEPYIKISEKFEKTKPNTFKRIK